MKSLLLGMMLVLSTSAFANDVYTCSATVDGYISAVVTDVKIEYGQGGVSLPLNEFHTIEIDIKSTGRSNKMPRNRIAYAVMFIDKVINRASAEFDGLPAELRIEDDKGELDVAVDCKLNEI